MWKQLQKLVAKMLNIYHLFASDSVVQLGDVSWSAFTWLIFAVRWWSGWIAGASVLYSLNLWKCCLDLFSWRGTVPRTRRVCAPPTKSTFQLFCSKSSRESHMAKQKSVWEGTIQRHEYREGNFDHQLANSLLVDMFNMDEILINK